MLAVKQGLANSFWQFKMLMLLYVRKTYTCKLKVREGLVVFKTLPEDSVAWSEVKWSEDFI